MAKIPLSDQRIKALLKEPREQEEEVADGTVQGLYLRLQPGGTATWTQLYRVRGEGGVNETGKSLQGRRHRISVLVNNRADYPTVSLQQARSVANKNLDCANNGVNPKDTLKVAATAGTLTVRHFSEVYMNECVRSRDLDCADLYQNAFDVHINPVIGECLAEIATREDVRKMMRVARVKRLNPSGRRGSVIGGVEASRTAVRVLRAMFTWGIDEEKLKRKDNPCRKMAKNLPKAKQGGVALSTPEARVVWRAARNCGFPFGNHAQLMMLTGCRKDEWASAQWDWIDLDAGLMVIPAENYKSDRVHVVPLVREAVDILRSLPRGGRGTYVFSSRDGKVKIAGVAKFYKTALRRAIIAEAQEMLTKRLTSHVLRRTVATRLAEILGYEGDKLVKRVLGHADSSVTALYNQYGYVREMRRALELWANELTSDDVPPARNSCRCGARHAVVDHGDQCRSDAELST